VRTQNSFLDTGRTFQAGTKDTGKEVSAIEEKHSILQVALDKQGKLFNGQKTRQDESNRPEGRKRSKWKRGLSYEPRTQAITQNGWGWRYGFTAEERSRPLERNRVESRGEGGDFRRIRFREFQGKGKDGSKGRRKA